MSPNRLSASPVNKYLAVAWLSPQPMIKNIDQILRLAQLTGDRLIIADQQSPERSLAVLSLSDYEELLSLAGLTKEQGFAKVDNDVASQAAGNVAVNSGFVQKIGQGQGKKSPWSIPASRQAAQKDIDNQF